MKTRLFFCFFIVSTAAFSQLRIGVSTPLYDSENYYQVNSYRDKWGGQQLINKGFPLQLEAGFRMWFKPTRKVGLDLMGIFTRNHSTVRVSKTIYSNGVLRYSESTEEVLEWIGGFSMGPLFALHQNGAHTIYLSSGLWIQAGLGTYLGAHYEWRSKYLSVGGFVKSRYGFASGRYGFGNTDSYPFAVLCGTELRINILD